MSLFRLSDHLDNREADLLIEAENKAEADKIAQEWGCYKICESCGDHYYSPPVEEPANPREVSKLELLVEKYRR